MPKTPAVFLLLGLCLFGAADALYKQWIPDTNYENKTNWDKGSVPCGNDIVQFSAQRKVSVYVETVHSVQEIRLPVDGEFILPSGGGFTVSNGGDPGCGAGVTAQFKDAESLQWFDPALWQAAESSDDLEKGRFLFSVHEESVPCQYDNVVFRAGSSFRVDTTSNQPSVPVQSVSVLGKKFSSSSEFTHYLGSHSGRLQFHGTSSPSVGASGCSDASGCDCGNSANHNRICGTVTCAPMSCKKPLYPIGHCCDMCSAIVTIQYSSGFILESYRIRLQHLFLGLPSYQSIQLGMSKVLKSQYFLGVIPRAAAAEIQIVLLDGGSGAVAEALARDILKDVQSQGSNLGITGAEFQASSGATSGDGAGDNAGVVVGAVFGILIVVVGLPLLAVLFRRGVIKMPSMPTISIPSLSSLRRSQEEIGDFTDHGFENPIFDKPTMMPEVPGIYGTEAANSISLTPSGVHFVNPAYDENETSIDFSA
ncbi:protein amnionless-like [Oncorhynchus mykiss]|uniref:protein amnionless-like n=1 Tax=Oncorhynchus mykiss TaxID=8022 RepID=UPI001877992E|nr:protein amnionless-like [Oncorhynchus mykiss]